jgi:hypothetical protein
MLSNRIIKRKISAILTAAALMLAPCGSLSATAVDEIQTAVPETQIFDTDGGTPEQKDLCVLSLKAEQNSVSPGGTLVVYIMVDSNPGINGLVFDVDFDTNVLKLKSKWVNKAFFEQSPHDVINNILDNGNVRYLWASATTVDENGNDVIFYDKGKIGKLTFEVKDTAALGSTTISVITDSMKVVRSLGSNEQRFKNVNVPFTVNECLVDIVEAKTISAAEVELEQSEFVYTGNPYTPAVTVTDGGKTLVKDVDYTVSYENNVNAGTASVTLTGMGDYTGSVTKTFEINPRNMADVYTSLSNKSFQFDGTRKTPDVTVKDDDEKLICGTDYTVSFSNNIDVGTAYVTITGKGNYTGVVKIKFKITEFVPGSLNNDNTIDVDDLVLMQKMIAGWNMGVNTDLGDLDGNDEFDINDLILMQKKVAGWSVEFA